MQCITGGSNSGVHVRRTGSTQQSKTIIGKVFHESRSNKYGTIINFAQVQKLTAEACGVSEMSVQCISSSLTSAKT